MKSFKQWVILERGDIFGFDKPRKVDVLSGNKYQHGLGTPGPNQGEFPIKAVDSQVIMAELARHNIGEKKARWVDTEGVLWGNGEVGTIQAEISPWGSYKVTVRKKIIDLEGTVCWICKRIYPIIETENDRNEESMAHQLIDELAKMDGELVEMPKGDYKNFENMILSLASKIKRFAPDIFIFDGIKQISENNYLIHMSLRAGGIEAPDSNRVVQFNIDLNYNPRTGLIRCFGNDVTTPTSGHAWRLQPSEWDEVFCATQPQREIEDAILAALSTY